MSNLYRFIVTALFILFFVSGQNVMAATPEFSVAAEEFLSDIDSGNFQAAYYRGSELLREANQEGVWIEATHRNQKLLGRVLKRNLKKIRPVTSPPGLPDGEYNLIYFESQTERKKKAAEVVLVEWTGNSWKVSSYSIR